MDDTMNNENWSYNPWLRRPGMSNDPPPPNYAIDILPQPGFEGQQSASCDTVADTQNYATAEGSVTLEVLKSIVYGGLMVVIASFSVVAAAAAADTPTVNIVALALASVVGGIFAIGRNLWDLRHDFNKGDLNQEAIHKYKELLGRLNYFPLHVVFAILSFVVFGMVPPVTYGFSYRETGDEDHTIVVVAIVSLFCVSLLAILKAYVTRCKRFFLYVKTVVYNVAIAVLVSGASYVAGILVSRLIKELGMFDLSSGVATTLLPRATTMSLSS